MDDFLRLMALLQLTTGGSPPRGTEITSLTWCNTSYQQRSWYIINSHLCTVYHYNKNEANGHRPMVIARFSPPSIAAMAVAFVSEVLPYWWFLLRHTGQDPRPGLSPLIWHTDDEPWDSSDLSNEMGLRSQKFPSLQVRITLEIWRQFERACSRFIVDRKVEPQTASVAQNAALQAGHSVHTELHHYALEASDLVGLSTQSLLEMEDVSRRWHLFIRQNAPIPSTSLAVKQSPLERNIALIREQLTSLTDRVTQLAAPTTVSSLCDPLASNTTVLKKRKFDQTEDHPPCPPSWEATMLHIRSLYGPQFAFRSSAQEEAVRALLSPDCPPNLVVRLPTGGGKTILIEVSALVFPTHLTVVVVPYISLKNDLLARFQRRGISARDFDAVRDDLKWTSVVVVVMETTQSLDFRSFIQRHHHSGVLVRTFWDEAHLIITENRFRPWQSALENWPTSEPRVFLSATLPIEVQQLLFQLARVAPTEVHTITAPSNIPTLQFDVTIADDPAALTADLQRQVSDAHHHEKHTIIFVKYTQDGTSLSEQFGWPFYYGQMPHREYTGPRMLQDFQNSSGGVLVATTALSHGVDILVDVVIFWKGSFDLITAVQQAGRAGRIPGRPGRCIFLLDGLPSITPGSLSPLDASGSMGPPPPLPGTLALHEFYHTSICRRFVLAAYFSEQWSYRQCQPNDLPCDLCRARLPTTTIATATTSTTPSAAAVDGATISAPSTACSLPQSATVDPGALFNATMASSTSNTPAGFGSSNSQRPSPALPIQPHPQQHPSHHTVLVAATAVTSSSSSSFSSSSSSSSSRPLASPQSHTGNRLGASLNGLTANEPTATNLSRVAETPLPPSAFSSSFSTNYGSSFSLPDSSGTSSATSSATSADSGLPLPTVPRPPSCTRYPIRPPRDNLVKMPPSARKDISLALATAEIELGVTCYTCFLDQRPSFDYQSHLTLAPTCPCTSPAYQQLVDECQLAARPYHRAIRVQLKSKSFHLSCALPLQPFHPDGTNLKENCARTGVIWGILVWALQHEPYKSRLSLHQPTPNDNADELVRLCCQWFGLQSRDYRLWQLASTVLQHRLELSDGGV